MFRSPVPAAALIAGMLLAAAPAPAQPPGGESLGRWVNPKKTVVVDTVACGDRLCGIVACAAPEAIEKAREKGTPNLVGISLLEKLQYRASEKRWRGKVFVPDMKGRFDAIMTPLPPDRIEVKGCILGGLICKKQIWDRVSVVSACERSLAP